MEFCMIQEKYEQAIKETFKYLNKCIAEQPKKGTIESLLSLGIDKRYIIESQMKKRGFEVKANYDALTEYIIVCPHQINLPIHIRREK